MSLVDFIGFIIAFLSLIFIFLKQKREQRRRVLYPEGEDQEEGQTLEEFLKSAEQQEAPPPPPRVPSASPSQKPRPTSSLEEYRHKSSLEKRTFKSSVEDRALQPQKSPNVKPAEAYEVIRNIKPSRGRRAIDRLAHISDILVLREVLDKPLSMRESPKDVIQ